MKLAVIAGLLAALCFGGDVSAETTEIRYLSGKGPSDAVEWDFKVSEGRKSGVWTKIPVPSNWEQHGFGGYDYGHVAPGDKNAESGRYRVNFHAPEEWKDKVVRLVFEGAMTDTSIKINGVPVGATHQGGYDRFSYTLTDIGKYGEHAFKAGEENTLEVLVAKKSANASLEAAERKADYWVFGGIYRPVYFEVLPKAFIHRVAIDAEASGMFSMDVFPQVHLPRSKGAENHVDRVVATVETLDGEPVGEPMVARLSGGGASRVRVSSKIAGIQAWSPEQPHLYHVRVTLEARGKTLHEITERFGFRSFEVRAGDGIYLNGKRILIRGVNRNGFRPDTARALDPEDAWADARAIKEMNANAVRCHLSPSVEFLKACDELGLLFMTERTNWQRPVADSSVSREIVYHLVTQLHNHPSLVMWANGNEGGFNHEVDELFALLDKQERPVIHPWATFDGIDTWHYGSYGKMKEKLRAGGNVYLPTEFLHGLFDGGHGAGLAEYWELMRASPVAAGGYLWCWADAAVARADQNGRLDTDGNHSADGIVGPNGEKEASWFAIREIWSPIQIELDELPAEFSGELPLENRFDETNLKRCGFQWRLLAFPDLFADSAEKRVLNSGRTLGPSVAPGGRGKLNLELPEDWRKADALELVAVDPLGREIMHWSWRIGKPSPVATKTAAVRGSPFEVEVGNVRWSFSPEDGRLIRCAKNGREIGLGRGPVLYAGTTKSAEKTAEDWAVKTFRENGAALIESRNSAGEWFRWTLGENGGARLEYAFAEIKNAVDYCAVGFDLSDERIAAKRWAGEGPYRVWANRREGGRYGLWENAYNDGITGVNWIYPEFKGVFADVDWMRVDLKSGARILFDPESPADVGISRPKNAEGDKKTGPRTATWAYPEEGGLFIFHKVPGVGTKFRDAAGVGPEGAPRPVSSARGSVSFSIR